jgi:hypothetical protein
MRRFVLVALLALSSCAENQVLVPQSERASLERQLSGAERYLKLSFFETPFFGDQTRLLLTALQPEEVRLLDNPDGTPINPGPVKQIFPVGTKARIKGIEFPTPLAMTGRVLMTPRYSPWVFLDIAGTPKDSVPYVLVLRMGLKTEADVLAEIDRYLSVDDPTARMTQWQQTVIDAVRSKQAVVDMPSDALEMTWGYPERKEISFEGDRRKEVWRWPGGKRVAVLLDGRVSELP